MAKRKRKVLVSLGIALLALVIIVATLPVWFPWALRPILQRYGVRYGACERIGYSRFALQKVTFVQDNTKFEAQRVEAPVPTVWLWWLYLRDRKSPGDWVRVFDWQLAVSNPTNHTGATSGTSAYLTFRAASADVLLVKKWLPSAALTNGLVVVDRTTFALSSATWDEGKLVARVTEPALRQNGILRADTSTNLSWRVSLKSDSLGLDSQFLIAENGTNLQITGPFLWRSNRVDVSAQFGKQGWIPERADAASRAFRIPAASLRLGGYDELNGSLDGHWENGRFAVDLNAQARPLTNTAYPPLQTVIHATGDTQAVTIETASITLPWLKAQLSGGARMDFKGHLLSPEAVVQVSADLAQQPWIALSGSLIGEARLRSNPAGYPTTSFNLSTTNLGIHALQTKSVALSGELSGAWPDPSYSVHGETVELKAPGLAPLMAQMDIRGQGASLENFNGHFIAGESSLAIAGNGKVAGQIDLRIETLDLNRHGEIEFKLAAPFAISYAPPNNGSGNQSRFGEVNLGPFHWAGNGRELTLEGRVAWPSTGSISSSASNIDLALFQDLVSKPMPQLHVGEFTFSGDWTNGPVRFETGVAGALLEGTNAPFSVEIQASGDQQGLSVRRLIVRTEREAVVSGQGVLPLTIEPERATNIVNLQTEQPLNFSASTRPNAAFWNEMASLVGVRLEDPRLDLNISGTPKAPQGKVTMVAKRIDFLKSSWNALRLADLSANVTIDQSRATLDQFRVFVQGQPINAIGEFPLAGRFSRDFKSVVDWDRSTARVTATNVQIAAFAPLVPDILAPRGQATLDLSVQPRQKLDGSLIVTGAATQPLGTMGAFLDVNAQLKLAGRSLAIQKCSGFLGGGQLDVTGGAQLELPVDGNLPHFEFRVNGSNVPLVREPDVIVRSDVSIVVSNAGKAEPVVSGKLVLRDSFYLKDLADLIPGEVSRPEERPPYFSISARPFADWRVDLVVNGTNFMKVRTPYFTGNISADGKVHGTLREPIAVGEARIVSGTILFPFSNMEVRQGLISLFSDNPFVPQLFVTAASKTFGYDIRLEITGPATQPKLEFFSTPPLTSEQALLMVTAGVLPEGEGSFTTQQRAQRLALFLGKSFLSKLGLSGDADRLTIRSGEYLTEQGGQTYSLEYRLSKALSIVGEYNRFDELVFSLKWKVYSK